MIVMNNANTNPKAESTILKLNQISQNPKLVYGLTSTHPSNQNNMKAASYVFSTPKAHGPSMQQPFIMATASTSSSSSSSSYRHHTGKALSYASSAINPTPTLNNNQQVYNPLVTLTSTNKDRLTYHGGSSKNYYKTSEITDAIGLNNSMESIDNLIAATNLKSQRQSAFHAPKPKIQYKVAQQQQAPVITTYANTKTIDALTKSLSTTSATTMLATNTTPSTMNITNYSYTNKLASRSQYDYKANDNNNVVIDFIVDQKLRNPKTKRNHNPYMSNTVDYDDFDVDLLNGQQHCVEQPKYLNNADGLSSTTGDNSLLLVNSLQLFSHFDVQSMLFNYNEIKLHKDSLHVSLNIRTGASAASRQSSMENINKVLNANSSTSSESSTSSSTSSSSTNGIMLNGTTARFGCTSSLRQRPSMSSPRSSLVVTTTAAALNFTSPHLCESTQACNQQVSNDLVENCPMFKNEIGGDTFRGLGLVNESQRRFMKLNSITLLDKINNSYRKDLIDVIESNNNEPFSIEYQDYGAYFYRYYFFNQGLDKFFFFWLRNKKRDFHQKEVYLKATT
jgi:hypothetical protein